MPPAAPCPERPSHTGSRADECKVTRCLAFGGTSQPCFIAGGTRPQDGARSAQRGLLSGQEGCTRGEDRGQRRRRWREAVVLSSKHLPLGRRLPAPAPARPAPSREVPAPSAHTQGVRYKLPYKTRFSGSERGQEPGRPGQPLASSQPASARGGARGLLLRALPPGPACPQTPLAPGGPPPRGRLA